VSEGDFEAGIAAWYAGLTPPERAVADGWGDLVEARVMMGDSAIPTPRGLLSVGKEPPIREKRPANPPHLFGGKR